MPDKFDQLRTQITACQLCRAQFATTATRHQPRPVFWLSQSAPILIAGQAPGARVHDSGRPFDDRSGDRLRNWMGIGRDQFYDPALISVLPMAFCCPGYDAKGSDLPPPIVCRRTWHGGVVASIDPPRLTLLVGGYAQAYHLPDEKTASVTDRIANWRAHAPRIFPLPHPSWRNTGWIRKNPWFETDLLPSLQSAVRTVLKDGDTG
jgi:uracil-DNA glycosylase